MKQPVKHFDLPKYHLNGQHYVPARARRSDEIERRRSLPSGTVLLEQQRDGLMIASRMVERAEEKPDIAYLSSMLAASAFNASWYTFAKDAQVMRRRLYLPELANEETQWRQTRSGLLEKARVDMAATTDMADALVMAKTGGYETRRQPIDLGRQMGNIGIELACLPLASATYGMSTAEAQLAAREAGLETLDGARELASKVGVNLSLAQLSDPDSPLSVDVRRHAPDNIFNAFEEVTEELRETA